MHPFFHVWLVYPSSSFPSIAPRIMIVQRQMISVCMQYEHPQFGKAIKKGSPGIYICAFGPTLTNKAE